MKNNLKKILSYAVLLCAFACQKNSDVVRDEYIKFYSSNNPSKEISVLQVPFEGESAKVIIKTNADIVVKFAPETAGGVDSWITFDEPVRISSGEYEINYTASRLLRDLDQRTASVNVTSPKIWLGSFLKVCQGYEFLWSPAAEDAPEAVTYSQPWKSDSVTGITELSHGFISFNAYATAPQALSADQTFQLRIALSEGAVFTDNGLQSYVVDVVQDTGFGWSNLVALPFKSTDSAFKIDTKVTLTVLSAIEGLIVNVDNLKIYNVTDDLREEGDGEEWEDPEGGEMEDIE